MIDRISNGAAATPAPITELPPVEILKSKTVQFSGRRVTINKIANPELPAPRPKIPVGKKLSLNAIEAYRNTPAVRRWQDEADQTTHLFIVATQVDGKATFLKWRHKRTEYQAWSNVDWKLLSGFSEIEQQGQRFVFLLMNTSLSSSDLPKNSPYQIPADFALDPGTYQVTQGDLDTSPAYQGISALHELYLSDYDRLEQAYQNRMKKAKQQAAERLANPPKPKDIVLHYWDVQPKNLPQKAERKTK